MKIHSIRIENYRQYKGPIDIDFSLDSEKNFTVIEGTNGAGKTNLLNAITWCLYEEELHKSGKRDSGDVIYNSITKNETKAGDTFDVVVSVTIIDNYDIKTTFTRSLQFKCDAKGHISRPPNSKFIVKNDLMGDEAIERPNLFINKELPKDIEGYFFFDGEKLGDYFDDNSGNSIKKSVYQLAQLNLIDSALKNLDKSKKYYSTKISKLDKNLGKKLSNRSNFEAKLRKYKKQKIEFNDEINSIKDKISELREDLKSIDPNIKVLEKERELLEKNKMILSKNIDKNMELKRKLVINKFPFVCAYPILQDALGLCKNTKNDNISQVLYNKELLEHILTENKCICGCDLSKEDHAREIILDLIEKSNVSSDLPSEIKNLLRNLNISLMEIEEVNDNINDYNDNIKSYESDLAEIYEDIEFNKFKLEGIDESGIKKLNAEIDSLEKNKEVLISKRKVAEIRYDEAKSELEKLIIDEKNQKIKNAHVIKLKNYEDFCRKSILNLEALKSKLISDIRHKLEKETTDQFLKLMWKDNFEKVLINNNYDFKLKNIFGELVSVSRLSAGEKLSLALSFVSALNSISGFNLPIIIDTPTGRLGTDMKSSVAETLPVYMADKQVTLLVTDEEYNDNFRNIILNKVGIEYKIEYHKQDNGEESRIVLNDR